MEGMRSVYYTYGHLLPDVQRAAAEAANRVFAARPRELT
jgi:hypothetical protein